MAQQNDNLPSAGARMTAAEFFQYPDSALPIELMNGVVMRWPTPPPDHQRLLGELAFAINKLIPDGEVFYSGLNLYLDDENVLQPDLAWVAKNSRCKLGANRLEGPPDLVIEILSPATAQNDRTAKFQVYEKHQISEYWLVDPQTRGIEVYKLDKDRLVQLGTYGAGKSFTSAALGGTRVDVSAMLGS